MTITIAQAKHQALKLKQTLLDDKMNNSSLSKKQIKEIVKLIDNFVKCHCSNNAIFTKYTLLKAKLSEVQECLR